MMTTYELWMDSFFIQTLCVLHNDDAPHWTLSFRWKCAFCVAANRFFFRLCEWSSETVVQFLLFDCKLWYGKNAFVFNYFTTYYKFVHKVCYFESDFHIELVFTIAPMYVEMVHEIFIVVGNCLRTARRHIYCFACAFVVVEMPTKWILRWTRDSLGNARRKKMRWRKKYTARM